MVSRHVVTLANSIVGVSVLAMPFCFKQCGIVLATVSLMIGAVMTRMVCYFLVKAALMNRRRTYEMLAWSTFGHTGKFMVEISIIGFLIGTLIAFMVVIGDLGPEILSEIFSVENNSSLRTIIMTALSLFVALPLGLLRNIDSLSSVSTASVLFYLFLVLKIFSEGIGPLWSGEYLERIHFWKSGGVLQCIPIFSMALSCQTQIFGIYDALPEPSLQKMNEVVKQAVNICTFFYFCVGFFGYIAFSNQNFGGNILLSFTPTWSTQLIKSMFLMSVVFSVPLVVFPCRASLHSLIFKSAAAYHHVHDMTTNYIPESRMKLLTVTIVGSTLVVGILIPNIELVLGLVGSTTGSVICIIFPSIMFVRVTSKNTTERLLAQLMFFIGVILMLLTTYATLYAAEQSQTAPEPFRVTENIKPIPPKDIQLNSPIADVDNGDGKLKQIHAVEFEPKIQEKIISKDDKRESHSQNDVKPPDKKESLATKDKDGIAQKIKSTSKPGVVQQQVKPEKQKQQDEPKQQDESKKTVSAANVEEIVQKKEEIPAKLENANVAPDKQNAPKKSDTDVHAQEQDVNANVDPKKDLVDKNVAEEFLKRLEEHQENQKKLLEEQKEILEELKQHHAHDVQEKLIQEKEKKKETEVVNSPLEDKKPNDVGNEGRNLNSNIKAQGSANMADKTIQEQEKIIEKISENIENENKNAELLEKLEEGLNKEVNKLDSHDQALPKNVQSEKHDSDNGSPNVEPNQEVVEKQLKIEETVKSGDDLKPAKQSATKLDPRGIDKEKGVLVGSLGGSRRESDVEIKSEASVSIKKAPESEKNSLPKEISNIQTGNENAKKSDKQAGNPSKKSDDLPVSDNNNHNKKIVEPASSPPSSKKPVSEVVPKEKIDREI